jgi:hypothetical protein
VAAALLTAGKFAELIERIHARKRTHRMVTAALLVNSHWKRLTTPVLRNQVVAARKAAASARQELADEIKKFWLYDLRAKAADDISDARGEQDGALLGHDSERTTQRHNLRRGRIVPPTK